MPYNPAIPGQITKFQMQAIETVASLIPENGKMVEVGSLFGSSSWCWAKSAHPSVTVYCVDPWENNAGIAPLERKYGVSYGIEQFRVYTRDCPNIVPMQGYSPTDFTEWSEAIDLYYEDAVHTDPVLSRNLDFWTGHLNPAGIVCGDDFRPRFPDVRNGAARLARRFGRTLITVENFWCLLPEDGALPGVPEVRERLTELSRQYRAEQDLRGPRADCRATGKKAGSDAEPSVSLELQIEPQGVHRWPAEPTGLPLELVYSIAAGHAPHDPLKWGRAQTRLDQIRPDIVERLNVSIDDLPSREGALVVDIALSDPGNPAEANIPLSRVMVDLAA